MAWGKLDSLAERRRSTQAIALRIADRQHSQTRQFGLGFGALGHDLAGGFFSEAVQGDGLR
jgi:hypothetical protein